MNNQQLIMGNSFSFRKKRALDNKRNKELAILYFIIYLAVAAGAIAGFRFISENDFDITGMLKYTFLERDGDCNIFVNGFNEEVKVCPEDLAQKEL